MQDVEGKVAFITGGASGIGLGIARAFSNAGMRIAIAYRDEGQRARAAQWFGVRPGVGGERLGVVAARPQLGQHQELDTARRGIVHHGEGNNHVLAWFPWCGQPLRHTNQKISLHVGYLDSHLCTAL